MSRTAADALQRRNQLAEEITALEFALRVYTRHNSAGAAGTVATQLAEARAQKAAIDAHLKGLAGMQ